MKNRLCHILGSVIILFSLLTSCTPTQTVSTYPDQEVVVDVKVGYRINEIATNLLAVTITDRRSLSFFDGLEKISESYVILDTTSLTERIGNGSRTWAILVHVEEE